MKKQNKTIYWRNYYKENKDKILAQRKARRLKTKEPIIIKTNWKQEFEKQKEINIFLKDELDTAYDTLIDEYNSHVKTLKNWNESTKMTLIEFGLLIIMGFTLGVVVTLSILL